MNTLSDKTKTQSIFTLFHMKWSRYFCFRFIRLTLLFIFLSYTLFVIADMIGHVKDILDPKTSKRLWCLYYAALFVRRLDILIPFSAGIAATIIMVRTVQDRVIIPLMCSGLSLKRFLVPFIAGAFLFTATLWVNYQWVYPKAIRVHTMALETEFGLKKAKEKENRLGLVMLPGGQRLFFNAHVPKDALLRDVFWYISENSICHIEELTYPVDKMRSRFPVGKGIEYFIRDPATGEFTRGASELEQVLPSLHISHEQVEIATSTPRELSLSNLLLVSNSYGSSKTERATATQIALYAKILTPFLAVFAVLVAGILSLRFEGKHSMTLTLLGIIIFLFTAHVILQAANVLARSPFIPVTLILLLPWLLFTYVIVRKLKSGIFKYS